jgi:ferrous iron transport protein B
MAADERTTRTVAIIGNPNTGKSTLFNALAGVRQRVGNYPGVTVEKKLGEFAYAGTRWTLIDLPGTYSLAPRSPDEMVAVDVLLGRRVDVPPPDALLCVVAADNLERNLYLVSQVRELGLPTVLALTMMDTSGARGVTIDVARLEQQLGVPVVPVQANRQLGLDTLKHALAAALDNPPPLPEGPFPQAFRAEVDGLASHFGPKSGLPRYLVERLLLDTGGYLEDRVVPREERESLRERVRVARERLTEAGCPVPAVEMVARYDWVARTVDGVVRHPAEPRVTLSDRIDVFLTHRLWGTLSLAALMLLIFNAVFSWAEIPMGWIDAAVGAVSSWVEGWLTAGALRSLLVEGVLGGIGSIIVFLPQILILFFFLGILEDCGYLARAAYLMDRLMVRVGLSGKSFIPLLSSFACAIPGVMATRVIEDRRDRLMTILIAPLMSCSARLPVYTLLIAAFVPRRTLLGGLLGLRGLTMFAMYLVGILTAAVVAKLLRRTLLRGPAPAFVMELPAYKWPSPRVVLHRMYESGWEFIRRAGTIILAVSIVMWAALYYPRLPAGTQVRLAADQAQLEGAQKRQSYLGRAGRLIEPVVRPLGWDWRIGSAVLASFPAREVVVATLGVMFDAGDVAAEGEGENRLRAALRSARREDTTRPLFNLPVALSLMVFFALCAQCVSTLAVIRRETNSWIWPAFSFGYMTALAYVGAFVTYQVGMRLLY